MARVCTAESSYGCGHHDEHVAAAKLGWMRRRLGAHFMGSREQGLLSRVVGEVQHAHTHPDHPGVIAFKQAGKWYELPRSEFRRLVSTGREIEHNEQAEARKRERERRAIEEYERAVADEERRAARRAQTAARQQERYRQAQQAQYRKMVRAERAEVVKLIKERGGIRAHVNRATGKAIDRGEVAMLPSEVRRKNGRLTLDNARELVMENMPWLQLDTPDDLVQFFEKSRVRMMHERYNGRHRRAFDAA